VYGDTAAAGFELSADAKRVRRYLEDVFVERGRGPNVPAIARELELGQDAAWDALAQLEHGVQVMFVPGTEDLVKMPPFSNVPTRHEVEIDGERRWYAGCAGEACAVNAMFPGKTVRVHSSCPACWQRVSITARDRVLVSKEPESTVIHWGLPATAFRHDWIVTCDSINFFCSRQHVADWEVAVPSRRGVVSTVEQGFTVVDGVARQRYWNYDRGPDIADAVAMTESYAAAGIDVTGWTT
jgi:hypothetical protein